VSRAWVVVGVSTVVNSLAWSPRATFALFYVALLGEFGWRRGDAAIGYSLSWLLLVVFSPLAGWLYDRWGARFLVPLGGVLLGAALALTGQVSSLAQYYIAFGVLGAAGIACIQMPAAAIVSRWFVQGRGTAMGIISAGSSASAIVFYPLNTWLIATLGWRPAFAVFGAIVALATVPLAALLYRDPPAEATDRAARDVTATAPAAATREWTFATALRSVPFWAVFSMWGFGVIGYQILSTHQVAHAIERGFDTQALGWVFGFGGLCTVIGNVLGGTMSDRWGREAVFAWGTVIGIAGIGALAALESRAGMPLLILYALSQVGFGMRISLLAAIPADLFAGKNLGVILGGAHAGGGLGGFFGPFLGGWLYDVSGSYQIAFLASAVTVALSAVAAWIAAPRRVRRAV